MVKFTVYELRQSDRGWGLFMEFVRTWKCAYKLLSNRLLSGCNTVELNTINWFAWVWVLEKVNFDKTGFKVWDVKEFSDSFMVSFLEYRGSKYAISVDFVTNRVRVMLIKKASDVYKACECDTRRVKYASK